ncbi:MAG TPA: heparinase II/III family protein [Thermoguttaceae bacterium]|nr:heparinase II/III family protein [Thermoguttaceae bacterium]
MLRTIQGPAVALAVWLAAVGVGRADETTDAPDRKSDYVARVTAGEGFMPWQEPGVSEEEVAFRRQIEARKDRMLAARVPVRHPVMLTPEEIDEAKRNIEVADWARAWFAGRKALADYVVAQPGDYVERMIPDLTPGFDYAFTCPNCVGEKSQEAACRPVWDYRRPDELRCPACGHVYPSADYPETGKLVCPRSGEAFTYYLNEEERSHTEDRSGKHAYRWVGKPMHVSFSGVIRERKVVFMIGAIKSLAFAYRFTGETAYAARAREALLRLAQGYRNWLYHDYWDGVADCDPMYAAYHDRDLPLEWKRHLSADAFARDTADRAAMLQNYWGAGRVHPSCDVATYLVDVCLAYDLIHDAENPDGSPLWSDEDRARVERDLVVEWLMGAEPFLGGPGEATNTNNKAGRVYYPMAAVARCLGLPEWADTALGGFEAQCERSLAYDGFSHESPAYTFSPASYIGGLLGIAESLHGFEWPDGFSRRSGQVDLYADGGRFRLLMLALVDHLLPDGSLPPLADTPVASRPGRDVVDVGFKRLPEQYANLFRVAGRWSSPSEYAVLHLDASAVETATGTDAELDPPEIYFPSLMTAILRHGRGPQAAALSLTFSPDGGHRHADNLSLFYTDRGHTILGDHGYIGDTPMNRWIRSTAGHNLVVVDDQEQLRRKGDECRRPQLHLMATSPRVSVCEASSSVYPQCEQYRRTVALVKGPGAETFAVDVFRVRGGKKHAWRAFSELASSDAPQGELRFEGVDVPPEPPLPQVAGSTKPDDIFGLRDLRAADAPPPTWQAIWSQADRSYRLWALSEVDRVEASNGPGQESRNQMGRRVRYVDAVRTGEGLASVFVAVHEPSGPSGNGTIHSASRLEVPQGAGSEAVAVKIESAWGDYLVLSDFAGQAEVDGVRFAGSFGVLCRTPTGEKWLFAVGAQTLQQDAFGFSGRSARWSGQVESNTETVIRTTTERPGDWPSTPEGCRGYVLAGDGAYDTGFPVEDVGSRTITVGRFPLPKLTSFQLPAVRSASD